MISRKLPWISLIFFYLWQNIYCQNEEEKRLLRRKRYVAFPEGAAFSAVYCVTSQTRLTDGASIFSEGVNWGLVYNLPNDTRPLFLHNKAAQKRRNRRDLYGKVEDILTSMGYNGRSCILRSLCEASTKFKSKEDSLIYHILSLIFRFPGEPILSHEPDDHRMYHWASQIGKKLMNGDELDISNKVGKTEDCGDIFQCPFSLIDLALGHYSGGRSLGNRGI